jgi:regulator of nucleoside diphosphate kinase
MHAAPHITITTQDLERLHDLVTLESNPAADRLDAELARARVVSPSALDRDVVPMNSDVAYGDVTSGVRRTVRIVYPHMADTARGYVSVLAPIGSALLGLRVGQEIEWRMPSGVRRVRVLDVPYQPEANGHFDL